MSQALRGNTVNIKKYLICSELENVQANASFLSV
jgi:hypothetical protein